MSGKVILGLIMGLALGGTAGLAANQFGFSFPSIRFGGGEGGVASEEGKKKIAYWVAPMDANYRRDGPGKSPMGMDLIPVYEGTEPGQQDEPGIEISPTVVNNIGIRTAKVERRDLQRRIETVGYVSYDEDKVSHVHLRPTTTRLRDGPAAWYWRSNLRSCRRFAGNWPERCRRARR